MAGTKMTIKRYGKNERMMYWDDLEIIVDQQYLVGGNGLYIYLDPYTYVPGIGQLEVHFNGQHLLSGGGYEEIDDRTIRLDLGSYPDDYSDPSLAGTEAQLSLNDEIHIRIWKLEYLEKQNSGGGPGAIDNDLLKRLEVEIIKARKYGDSDSPHPDLDTRLDSIERRAESKTMVFVVSKVRAGKVKVGLRFPYKGVITAIHADCEVEGIDDTEISIEKCSHQEFTTTPSWTNILQTNLVIDGGERSSDTSNSPHTVADTEVNEDDHYRLVIESVGEGIEGLTVQLVIRVL
ncbi:hypothetical protein [Paenibacillus sp. NPDC057967]|uniref:hypothetical protein n=1 Tax=Paenibacillus sp. NPDC057967 TaxID=3346293 RepID=UPI0036DDEC73